MQNHRIYFSIAVLLCSGIALAEAGRNLQSDVKEIEDRGIYEIVSVSSHKCLDVVDHSLSQGSEIQQWRCHGGDNQRFIATAAQELGFILSPVESEIRLQIADRGAELNLDNGALLIQKDYAIGTNGFFFFRPTDRVGVFTIVANASSKCLDVRDNRRFNGARIQQWDCHGGNNQKWVFHRVGTFN